MLSTEDLELDDNQNAAKFCGHTIITESDQASPDTGNKKGKAACLLKRNVPRKKPDNQNKSNINGVNQKTRKSLTKISKLVVNNFSKKEKVRSGSTISKGTLDSGTKKPQLSNARGTISKIKKNNNSLMIIDNEDDDVVEVVPHETSEISIVSVRKVNENKAPALNYKKNYIPPPLKPQKRRKQVKYIEKSIPKEQSTPTINHQFASQPRFPSHDWPVDISVVNSSAKTTAHLETTKNEIPQAHMNQSMINNQQFHFPNLRNDSNALFSSLLREAAARTTISSNTNKYNESNAFFNQQFSLNNPLFQTQAYKNNLEISLVPDVRTKKSDVGTNLFKSDKAHLTYNHCLTPSSNPSQFQPQNSRKNNKIQAIKPIKNTTFKISPVHIEPVRQEKAQNCHDTVSQPPKMSCVQIKPIKGKKSHSQINLNIPSIAHVEPQKVMKKKYPGIPGISEVLSRTSSLQIEPVINEKQSCLNQNKNFSTPFLSNFTNPLDYTEQFKRDGTLSYNNPNPLANYKQYLQTHLPKNKSLDITLVNDTVRENFIQPQNKNNEYPTNPIKNVPSDWNIKPNNQIHITPVDKKRALPSEFTGEKPAKKIGSIKSKYNFQENKINDVVISTVPNKTVKSKKKTTVDKKSSQIIQPLQIPSATQVTPVASPLNIGVIVNNTCQKNDADVSKAHLKNNSLNTDILSKSKSNKKINSTSKINVESSVYKPIETEAIDLRVGKNSSATVSSHHTTQINLTTNFKKASNAKKKVVASYKSKQSAKRRSRAEKLFNLEKEKDDPLLFASTEKNIEPCKEANNVKTSTQPVIKKNVSEKPKVTQPIKTVNTRSSRSNTQASNQSTSTGTSTRPAKTEVPLSQEFIKFFCYALEAIYESDEDDEPRRTYVDTSDSETEYKDPPSNFFMRVKDSSKNNDNSSEAASCSNKKS